MQRRSALRATPRQKYTVDAFEGIAELQESEHETSRDVSPADNDDSSEGFQEEPAELAADEDRMSDVEEDEDTAEQSSEDEQLLDQTPSSRGKTQQHETEHTPRRRIRRPVPVTIDENETFNRGIPDVYSKLYSHSKEQRWLHHYGPSSNDRDPVFKAKKRWAHDTCLPSRTGVDEAFGGFHASYFLEQPEISTLIEESSRWLMDDDGLKRFDERQVSAQISELEAQRYLDSMHLGKPRAVVMGPFRDQNLFHFEINKPYSLQDAWEMDRSRRAAGWIQERVHLKPGWPS